MKEFSLFLVVSDCFVCISRGLTEAGQGLVMCPSADFLFVHQSDSFQGCPLCNYNSNFISNEDLEFTQHHYCNAENSSKIFYQK